MRYGIILAPQAIEDLAELKAHVRKEVREGIETHLRHQPELLSRSRIKRLRKLAQPLYRLRLGDIRVFYDVREATVEVLAIVAKSEAAAWLAKHAKPEAK